MDYLNKVKEYSFLEAVELLAGQANIQPPLSVSCVQRSRTTLAGESPVTVIASEPCS